MTTEQASMTEPEAELFLENALRLAREIVVLRSRLEIARREHTALLAQREDSLSEGIDLLPEIKSLHREIEKLPLEISRLEQRVHWLVDQGIEKTNSDNDRISGQEYIKNRDALRNVLEPFRDALASILQNVEASEELGPSLTEGPNVRVAEIEKLLGNVHFSRVSYRTPCLPPLDDELVRRNQPLAAIDRLIGGLR